MNKSNYHLLDCKFNGTNFDKSRPSLQVHTQYSFRTNSNNPYCVYDFIRIFLISNLSSNWKKKYTYQSTEGTDRSINVCFRWSRMASIWPLQHASVADVTDNYWHFEKKNLRMEWNDERKHFRSNSLTFFFFFIRIKCVSPS